MEAVLLKAQWKQMASPWKQYFSQKGDPKVEQLLGDLMGSVANIAAQNPFHHLEDDQGFLEVPCCFQS
jgi:hypothetical protein